MAVADENGSKVSYTTKELLGRIEQKIDGIDDKLDSKADKSMVDALQVQLEVLRETAVRREGPLMKEYWDYTHETRGRVEDLERVSTEREQYIEPLKKLVDDVSSLKTWRTRIAAVLALITPLAFIAVAGLIQRLLQ